MLAPAIRAQCKYMLRFCTNNTMVKFPFNVVYLCLPHAKFPLYTPYIYAYVRRIRDSNALCRLYRRFIYVKGDGVNVYTRIYIGSMCERTANICRISSGSSAARTRHLWCLMCAHEKEVKGVVANAHFALNYVSGYKEVGSKN